MSKYYDGTKLLSMKDLNGKTPEIFITTSNRNAGKTTFFNKFLFTEYLRTGKPFCLVYRFQNDIDMAAEKFFSDIGPRWFPQYFMLSKPEAKGKFLSLRLGEVNENDEEKIPDRICGFAVSLNAAGTLKRYSHFFNDVSWLFLDEFEEEFDNYAPNEIQKFISLHTSFARGFGEQVRYLPVIMAGNPVSILNPYFVELGISERLRADTKYLRGDGFVLESNFNESAASANIGSAFNRAFAQNSYIGYASQGVYLNDSTAFVEKMDGKNTYLATVKCMGTEYALRQYTQQGIIYCDKRVDSTFTGRLSVTTDDHNVNYVMLRSNMLFLNQIRYYFNKGAFRFRDLQCKSAVLKMLSY